MGWLCMSIGKLRVEMPKLPKMPKVPKIVERAFSTINLIYNWQ